MEFLFLGCHDDEDEQERPAADWICMHGCCCFHVRVSAISIIRHVPLHKAVVVVSLRPLGITSVVASLSRNPVMPLPFAPFSPFCASKLVSLTFEPFAPSTANGTPFFPETPNVKCCLACSTNTHMMFSLSLQIAAHDRDMTLVTQILWGRTTHVSCVSVCVEKIRVVVAVSVTRPLKRRLTTRSK